MFKQVIVHRNGTDYGPYTPLAICEMLHKGKLLHQDYARLENGTEWTSLDITMADAIDRSFVEVKESDISKRALTTGIPLLLCGYFAYQKHFVTNDPFWAWMNTIAVFLLLFDYFLPRETP